MDYAKRVLVVVVTYNSMQWIERCMQSLANSEHPADVLVVDNGSADGTAEYIAAHYPEVTLIRPGRNLGFGAANNIGMGKALELGYGYVYLLNQDAWIFPDTFTNLCQVCDRNPDYGIISPLQYGGDERRLDAGFERVCKRALSRLETDGGEVAEVPFVMAAHWMIPRQALGKTGGFSPAFFHYGEDNNYLDRMRHNGYKIGVAPAARAVHDRNERPVSWDKRLYLKQTSLLIRLSRPDVPMFRNVVESMALSLAFAAKEVSLRPLRDMMRHLRRLRFIQQCRLASRRPAPFLQSEMQMAESSEG